MDQGLDYSVGRPDLGQVWAAGYRFVFRYLSWLPNPKCIGAVELGALRARGFQVALNWEFDQYDARGGASVGNTHGREAVRQAQALGYPAGATIYFSADFDSTPGEAATIEAYMWAAGTQAHAAGYRMGAYGGYWTIRRLLDAGAIQDGWQTYAWSLAVAGVDPGPNAVTVNLRGLNYWFDRRAAMRQVLNGVTVAGADVDIDERWGPTFLMGQSAQTEGIDDMTPEQDSMLRDVHAALARLEATDNRIREGIVFGRETLNDDPGEGPGTPIELVRRVNEILAAVKVPTASQEQVTTAVKTALADPGIAAILAAAVNADASKRLAE